MMPQAKQDPILQRVDSPEILLCPCGRTRKLIVGIGGIGERISDKYGKSSGVPLDNDGIG